MSYDLMCKIDGLRHDICSLTELLSSIGVNPTDSYIGSVDMCIPEGSETGTVLTDQEFLGDAADGGEGQSFIDAVAPSTVVETPAPSPDGSYSSYSDTFGDINYTVEMVDYTTGGAPSTYVRRGFLVETPASQDTASFTQSGFDQTVGSSSNRNGFLISFDSPINALGLTVLDLESDPAFLSAEMILFDTTETVLSSIPINFPNGEDGDQESHFIGFTRALPDVSHVVIAVGASTDDPNADNNRLAFGRLRYLQEPSPSNGDYTQIVGVDTAGNMICKFFDADKRQVTDQTIIDSLEPCETEELRKLCEIVDLLNGQPQESTTLDVEALCNPETNMWEWYITPITGSTSGAAMVIPSGVSCDQPKPEYGQVKLCDSETGTWHIITSQINTDGTVTELSDYDTGEPCIPESRVVAVEVKCDVTPFIEIDGAQYFKTPCDNTGTVFKWVHGTEDIAIINEQTIVGGWAYVTDSAIDPANCSVEAAAVLPGSPPDPNLIQVQVENVEFERFKYESSDSVLYYVDMIENGEGGLINYTPTGIVAECATAKPSIVKLDPVCMQVDNEPRIVIPVVEHHAVLNMFTPAGYLDPYTGTQITGQVEKPETVDNCCETEPLPAPIVVVEN